MINILDKKDCCGCEACHQICPTKCIEMKRDEEGFLYPYVDTGHCTQCNLCEKVCPVINQGSKKMPLHTLAAKNKNEKIRQESSSGGIFTLLAEKIIEDGGVVFGAKFNEKWEVIHDYTEHIDGLKDFRGSKYVQSVIGDTFQKVKAFLLQGRKVLFSGTPCQIAGLHLFLRKKYDNLLSIDFVCHGVPSPQVFTKYIENIAQKSNNSASNIAQISFRNKSYGWKKFCFLLSFGSTNKDKNILEALNKNIFMKGFLADLYLRPACYACPSKCFNSGSDITIGDYWGIEKKYPDFDDDKGVSLVFLNNIKGNNYYKDINAESIETKYEDALIYNTSIEKSVKEPNNRKVFFEFFLKEDIESLILKLTKQSLISRIKNKIKNHLT